MHRIRAVVVDDDAELRGLLRLQLELAGDIDIVGEGQDAEEVIDLTDKLHPDVIILDEKMPGRSGIEVIPEVIAAHPDAVVIVYTGNSGTHTRDAVIRAGGHAVVGKTDPSDLLVGTIHRLLPCETEQTEVADDQFGDRMTELLHRDSHERSGRQTLRDRGIRPWFVIGAMALLPLLLAAVWFLAMAVGLIGR